EFFDTRCSCLVGRNCRHVYAALLAAVQMTYKPREDLPQPDPDANRYEVRPLWGAGAAVPGDAGSGPAEPETPEAPVPLGVPSPVVRLFCEYPFTGYMGWYGGVPYGENIRLLALEFTYAEAPGEVFGFGAGRMNFGSWQRDAMEERACFNKLESLGLKRCGSALSHALKAHLRDVLLFHPIDPEPWDELLLVRLPALSAEGWRITTDSSFDMEILHPDFFYEEVEATSKTDWFSADIGIESGGQKISLLPLLVSYLKRQPAALRPELLLEKGESPVLIPLEDGRRAVPVPASRLYRILTSLTELFSRKIKPDGPGFSLHRLHAAAFLTGDGDELLVRRTADSLRSLVTHLKKEQSQNPEAPAEELELPPAGLQADLRPYQLAGFRWLRLLARHGLGGILADDMGLGKTLQTLAHLLAESVSGAAEGRPCLIICPTSVLHNWSDEAKKFAPSLSVHVHYGSERAALLRQAGSPDLIITSYPLLVRDIEVLETMEFHAVVLDEAQFIKNPRTQAASCAGRLQSKLRLCLTGTPMENHLGELWSILHFLMPGYLGGWDDFTRLFRTPIEKQQDGQKRAQLARRIAPVFLRRTKQAVLSDLPPRIDMIHRITLPAAQADLYESVRAAMDRHVREEIDKRGVERSHIAILDALLKLRQVCCHPALLKMESARLVTEGAKLDFFGGLVPELVEEGRRILVFSQFVEMLGLISKRLEKLKIPHLMLTGQTKNRAAMVAQFQCGEVPVFLISLKAGGTGLNLTAADTVIHYDPWWNPAVEAQATDRAHRFGQQHTVFVHKLICEGTIEEKILKLQEKKAALVAGLLSGEANAAKFSPEDLDDLLAPLA
ncbi:MAG: box helicase, partial [Verrucomicrobiales bacterium]|nr:box helicase [Verrucomicrobiales bacterium]